MTHVCRRSGRTAAAHLQGRTHSTHMPHKPCPQPRRRHRRHVAISSCVIFYVASPLFAAARGAIEKKAFFITSWRALEAELVD
eukprot:scaffold112568_cov60-Phaeocystis_antarctica.AAC.1